MRRKHSVFDRHAKICDGIILFKLKDYTIRKCPVTEVMYNANFPPEKTSECTFSSHYYNTVQSEAFKPEYIDNKKDPYYEKYNRILEEMGETITCSKKSLFEVGYGRGIFLKSALDRGWNVQGMEISHDAFEYVKKNITSNVKYGDLLNEGYSKGEFDLMAFWDSIEHIVNPKAYLLKAYSMLKPGGMIVITTDIYDSLLGCLSRIIYKISFGLIRWPVKRVYIPYNSFYFTTTTFNKILTDSGFSIIKQKRFNYPISKINLNNFEKIIVFLLYSVGTLFKRQMQLYTIAEKKT